MTKAIPENTVILVPGRLAEPHEIVAPAKLLASKAHAAGWETKTGYAKSYTPPQVYGPTAAKAGEEHGEVHRETVWVQGIHRERKKKFSVTWYNEKFETALWGMKLVGPELLGELIKGTFEEPPVIEEWRAFKAARAAANKAKAEEIKARKEAKNG